MDEDRDDIEADMICDEEERLSETRLWLRPEWEPFDVAIVYDLSPPGDGGDCWIYAALEVTSSQGFWFVISKTWPSRLGEGGISGCSCRRVRLSNASEHVLDLVKPLGPFSVIVSCFLPRHFGGVSAGASSPAVHH